MRSPASRTFSFLSGILIGMLAAVGLMFLVLNQYNPMKLFYKSEQFIDADTVVDFRTMAPQIPLKSGEKKISPVKSQYVQPKPADTLVTQKNLQDFEEPIVVKKDEFLGFVEVKILSVSEKRVKEMDSILQSLQGGTVSENYRVDFFRSPLNFSGYKLRGRTLTLYGMPFNKKIKLYRYNSQVFLRTGEFLYRLIESDEYQDFEAVVDPFLINVLNS